MSNQFLEEARALKPQLVEWRRTFHQIPELGLQLPQTMAYVISELEKMGIAYTAYPECSCVTVVLGQGEPCLMLRSDMDALPVVEDSGELFASTNGCMHACGHDMHATTLLGAAKLLHDHESELQGTVKLLFQSGEEIFAGALAAIEAGVLENPHVDAAFALHVAPNAKLGEVASGEYPTTSVYGFRITIHGKGCHGSMPYLGVDPINAGVHVFLGFQELISREISASEEVALTLGRFESGRASNVIPDSAVLAGTLRTYKAEMREYMIARMHEVCRLICEAYRCTYEIEVESSVPALHCDMELVAEALDSIRKVDDTLDLSATLHAMGSEDFAVFSEHVPSAFFFFGTGVDDPTEWRPHHNPQAKFNEEGLPLTSAIYAQVAIDWLGKHAK